MFDFLDMEWDMASIMGLCLGAASIFGIYFLFSFWATKGYDPKLHIKIATYVLAPVVSFFIVQWQSKKE